MEVWGDKLKELKSTAMDRVGIRRLLMTIEKQTGYVLSNYVGDVNDNITRNAIIHNLSSLLDVYHSKGLMQDFNVVCDETNNSPKTIDNNRLNVDLYIQPMESVDYIQINTVVSSSGLSFDDNLQVTVTSEIDEYIDRLGM